MAWYVARTKPGREQQATAILDQRGVGVFLPTLPRRRPRAGQRTWEPLFPGYLFAQLELRSEQWLLARSAPYVSYFLGERGEPSAVPDDFVTALRARVD